MAELSSKLGSWVDVAYSAPVGFYLTRPCWGEEKRSQLRGHPQDFEFFSKSTKAKAAISWKSERTEF